MYHLTHRCHDRRFLLRTIRERKDYRKWLREGAHRYALPIYNTGTGTPGAVCVREANSCYKSNRA